METSRIETPPQKHNNIAKNKSIIFEKNTNIFEKSIDKQEIMLYDVYRIKFNKRGGDGLIDTQKLQGKMREHGYTINSLAKKLGISNTSLFNKIHNIQEFVVSEMQMIANLLHLTKSEIQAIFFAKFVESESTRKEKE